MTAYAALDVSKKSTSIHVVEKGTDLSQHGAGELEAIAHALNTRPRKTLGWKTPAEVLDQVL